MRRCWRSKAAMPACRPRQVQRPRHLPTSRCGVTPRRPASRPVSLPLHLHVHFHASPSSSLSSSPHSPATPQRRTALTRKPTTQCPPSAPAPATRAKPRTPPGDPRPGPPRSLGRRPSNDGSTRSRHSGHHDRAPGAAVSAPWTRAGGKGSGNEKPPGPPSLLLAALRAWSSASHTTSKQLLERASAAPCQRPAIPHRPMGRPGRPTMRRGRGRPPG